MRGMDVYPPFTHICSLSDALIVAKVLSTRFPLGRSRISISDRLILLAIAVTNSNLDIMSAGTRWCVPGVNPEFSIIPRQILENAWVVIPFQK